MTAAEFMSRKFDSVRHDAPIEEAAAKLESSGLNPLPVCENGRLIGFITPGELGIASARESRSGSIRVCDVIGPDLLFCLESTELSEAVTLMKGKQLRWIPVLGPFRELVGVLNLESIPGEGVEISE